MLRGYGKKLWKVYRKAECRAQFCPCKPSKIILIPITWLPYQGALLPTSLLSTVQTDSSTRKQPSASPNCLPCGPAVERMEGQKGGVLGPNPKSIP